MAPLQLFARVSTSFLTRSVFSKFSIDNTHFLLILALFYVCYRPFINVYKVCSFSQILKDAPKRPPNAYALFFRDIRQDIPTRRVPEMGKIIGEKWRGLDDEEKNKYRAQSEVLKNKYVKEKTDFLLELSWSEKKEMKEEIRQKKLARQKRRKQAENRKLLKPKPGPTSSFACFLKEKEHTRSGQPITEFVKHLAVEWKQMSSDDKTPFIEQAEQNRQSYQNKLEIWEKDMINAGREDLVRKSKVPKS